MFTRKNLSLLILSVFAVVGFFSSHIAQCEPINWESGFAPGYDQNGDSGCVYISPIILQMNHGAGFELSTAHDGIPFDLNEDGKLERISSPLDAADVGFLYLKNDYSHDGKNLFGNKSSQKRVPGIEPNGFRALAQWDDPELSADRKQIVGPPDGKITKADGVWKNLLRVWFDLNRDGQINTGELKTLDELGIVQLDLDYVENERRDGNGNKLRMLGKFWKAGDNQPYFMTDYGAASEPIVNQNQ